ncbi:MAG: LamG domain-containing protein [Bacteroidetes bacterium]|nr:LamG domain-containing protein [Bacteroidota bacterium]MBU1372894.1 LamG domain-containing protein [Bacteroidota bacterium]MBU1485623.1 LamG domain-containing protein [Bacteroidota bacterium]MBU1760540.1 LamG domain-containing protein [Bacteroidota bacterium]MBU2268914.1 LamG domain-containing protein [Bacteroidota bacterium]
MKSKILNINQLMMITLAIAAISSCKKDGNPNKLPSVSTAAYAGTIDGYKSSDEIFPNNLVAFWSFDTDTKEIKSGSAPTSMANNTLIDGGVRGKALSLNGGYLYYATQFSAFKAAAFTSFTISTWVQILNNGATKTMLFQISRPGMMNGNLDFILETNANATSNTDRISIHPYFTTAGGGRQDNINNYGAINLSPKIGAAKWTNILLTYDGSSGVFNIWADGVKMGNYPNRGTGKNLFKSWEPNEVIIGGNYNVIPGKSVNSDASFAAMKGNIDEIRIFNKALPDAHIKALFNLGLAGK